jgi:hypothetical protein
MWKIMPLEVEVRRKIYTDWVNANRSLGKLLKEGINHPVLEGRYLKTKIDKEREIDMNAPNGEAAYFSMVRNALEIVLFGNGSLPKHLLPSCAPKYLSDLVSVEYGVIMPEIEIFDGKAEDCNTEGNLYQIDTPLKEGDKK